MHKIAGFALAALMAVTAIGSSPIRASAAETVQEGCEDKNSSGLAFSEDMKDTGAAEELMEGSDRAGKESMGTEGELTSAGEEMTGEEDIPGGRTTFTGEQDLSAEETCIQEITEEELPACADAPCVETEEGSEKEARPDTATISPEGEPDGQGDDLSLMGRSDERTDIEEPAGEGDVNAAVLFTAPDAETAEEGTELTEVTVTVHHDSEVIFSQSFLREEEPDCAIEETHEETGKEYYYQCTVCGFTSMGSPSVMYGHLSEAHPTDGGIHYYDPISGEEIYPSYSEKSRIVVRHYDAETQKVSVYEKKREVIDAYDEEVPTGAFRYVIDGEAVTDRLIAVDGETYYFDSDGISVTGLREVNGSLYYFGEDCRMQTGKITDGGKTLYADSETGKLVRDSFLAVDNGTYYFGSDGYAVTGWQEIDGGTYQFDDDGRLQTGWIIKDGKELYADLDTGKLVRDGWADTDKGTFYFGNDGAKATGIVYVGDKFYPVGDDGALRENAWVNVNGSEYYAGMDGASVIGWNEIGDKTYYFDGNGVKQTGLITDGEMTYPTGEDGALIKDGWVIVDGDRYHTDESGAAVTGRQVIKDAGTSEENTYYFDENGVMKTGVIDDNGDAWLLDDDGRLVTVKGWVTINDKQYYIEDNGRAATGWRSIGGKKYYFIDPRVSSYKTADLGKMATGWKAVGTRVYYFTDARYMGYRKENRGAVLTGWRTIDGRRYYFMDDKCSGYTEPKTGVLLSGFREISGKTYYFTDRRTAGYREWKRGMLLSGHVTISGSRYFFSKSGVMARGRFVTVRGKKYYFSSTGKMLRERWITVNGRKFYLEKSGRMHTGILKKNGRMYYFGWNGVLVVNRRIRVNGRWYRADTNGVLR